MIDSEQKNEEVVESRSSTNDSETKSEDSENKSSNGVLKDKNEISCSPGSAKEDDQLPATSNGHPVPTSHKDSSKEEEAKPADKVECIELDDEEDDEVIAMEEPPIKRSKVRSKPPSPVPEDPKNSSNKEENSTVVSQPGSVKSLGGKKEPELTSYSALLDRLEVYVKTAIEKSEDVDRKVLDALLAAINILVKKEPYSVRKLILDKQLVLPNTISFPPSQVVEMLIEHDPDFSLSRVIAKMFKNEQIKLSDIERKERQQLKVTCPAPNLTGILMYIGQDLVQESTYYDIVHARNLPEVPKNMETYNQVAAQLRPVWEALKAKNEPFKLQLQTCQVSYCGFKTDSKTVMLIHRQTPHFCGRKYQCAMCNEFDTNENRINRHYLEAHGVKAMSRDDYVAKVQCPICDEDFTFKGQRDTHLKMCKRDIHKIRTLQSSRAPEHTGMVNRWLWDKPPVDPAILAQQQDIQRANQIKQHQMIQQQQRQYAAALARSQASNSMPSRLLAAQQNFRGVNNNFSPNNRSQQVGQLGQMLKNGAGNGNPSALTPQMIQAAMQHQLRQQMATKANIKSAANALQKQMPPKERGATQFKNSLTSNFSTTPASPTISGPVCEICDQQVNNKEQYLSHLKELHQQLKGKTHADMVQGAPLACSRCRDRFWTYEGLERHLVMGHGLVTSHLLNKAQKKEDGGKCKLCGKQYAFNMLQHLVSEHQVKLCSAEIMYSCDVCSFKCGSYQLLESHLTEKHPKQICVPIS